MTKTIKRHIGIYIIICFVLVSCRSYLDKELDRVNKAWNETFEVVADVCDTLVINDNQYSQSRYTEDSYPYFKPHYYDSSVTCYSYSYGNFGVYNLERNIDTSIVIGKINAEIKRGGSTIKYIRIENPSFILFELDFAPLDSINTLEIWGNDFGTDAIRYIPESLLSKPSFRNIVNNGVRMPRQKLDSILISYPKISISGDTILDYKVSCDHSDINH